MGLLPIKAPYLTWFFMLLNIMMGDSIKSDLIGILIGHFYYYMTEILPNLPKFKNLHPFSTPKFMFQLRNSILRLDLCSSFGVDVEKMNEIVP